MMAVHLLKSLISGSIETIMTSVDMSECSNESQVYDIHTQILSPRLKGDPHMATQVSREKANRNTGVCVWNNF